GSEKNIEETWALCLAAWRYANVIFGPRPKDKSGDAHQNSRHKKREAVTAVVLNPRDYYERKERAQIDRPVKRAVGFLQQVRLLGFEWAANEPRHTRLNTTRAESDEAQSDTKENHFAINAPGKIAARQHAVSSTIEKRYPQNGVIASDYFV